MKITCLIYESLVGKCTKGKIIQNIKKFTEKIKEFIVVWFDSCKALEYEMINYYRAQRGEALNHIPNLNGLEGLKP